MKNIIFLFVFLIPLTFTAFSGEVEYSYHFGKPTVVANGEYQSLNFENTMLTALPGQPAMPYHQVKLMLPPGESAQNIEIIFSGETQIPGKFNLYPQQGVQPISIGKSGQFIKDEALYSRNATYPANPKGQLITAFLNGRAFALSSFTPVQYNPVTGKLSYYASAKVIVHTQADQKSQAALSNLVANSQQAARLADNSETDNLYKASRQPITDGYELLIICTSAYSTAFDDYRASYLKQGLRSQVITLESITSTMIGIDVPEKIRNYIIQEHQAHEIEHVLLAGDVELIPYRGFYCYVQSGSGYTSSNIPSDLYYSALDGNWNTDGDALWGEPGEDDLLPDISVARMPFSNLTELNSMLHKSYNYQFSPVDGEFRNIILAGEYLYGAPYLTWGSYYMELLLGHHTDNGYTTTGIPTTYPVDKMYDETATWSKQDLMNHLNMGRPMLNHTGHANQTYVMKLSSSDITNANFSGLDGTAHNYTIVNTHGCDCGAFDYNDCIAEKMVTIDNFAAAFIGNSRFGWFNEGTNEGPSAHLHREYMDALYSDLLNRIGSAHTESKIATAPWVTAPGQWEPGALRWCFYDCTVLGDPAMAVFTDNPITVQTDYSNVTAGSTSMDVSVTSGSLPMLGLSCVVLENGIMLGKALTNASGTATVVLNPAVSNPAEVQLVVSGYNCVPVTYNLSAKTYSWNVASGNWKTPANWLPVRTNPAANDILVFDGNIQANASVSLDFTTAENLGKLRIINNSNVTLTSSASRKINIGTSGSISPHFEIGTGSTLNVNSANAVSINLPIGCLASVSGNIIFQNAAHQFTSAGEGGITFNNGSSFTAGTGFSKNAFGTTSYNSIVFASGSTYIQEAGSNPFGATQPNSVLVFQTGSLFKLKTNSAPSLDGRTYANFEVDVAAFSQSFTGATGVTMDNLTLTNSTLVGMNLTGAMNIKGNITVNNGTLSFSPATLTNVNLNGTSAQTISGSGTLTIESNASFVVDNTVIADRNITFGGNLSINPGKSFTINAGKQITVGGILANISDAGLIIKSDATGTGSLITGSTPNATVERYITGASNAWHQISSPVAAQAIEPGFVPSLTSNNEDFFTWYETDGVWVNYKNTGTAPTWNTTNGSTNFVPGKGYLVAYQASNPTKAFTGTLNSGTINFAMTTSGTAGFAKTNLAGNPYPSSIDWKSASGWIKTNIMEENGGGHTFYTWNESESNYGAYNDASGSDIGTLGVTRQIAPMQGFIVTAASAGNLSMTDAVRVHSTQAWLKSGNEGFRLKVNAPGNNGSDEISFELGHNSSIGGAAKWNSFVAEAPSLSTPKSGTEYSISFLESLTNETVIPVTFKAGIDGQYSLAANLENLSKAQIYLVDNKLNKTQNLSDNPVYTFAASTTDEPNRFKLTFKTVGINETVFEHPFNIYATDNTVYVANTSATSIKGEVYVYNTLGQVTAHQNLNGDLTKLNLAAAAGYYLVKVITKETTFTGKVFLKQ